MSDPVVVVVQSLPVQVKLYEFTADGEKRWAVTLVASIDGKDLHASFGASRTPLGALQAATTKPPLGIFGL